MKVIATLLATTAILASAEMTKEEKDTSFFQGLENGFFMRNEKEGYKKYDCPDLVPNQDVLRRFHQHLAPAEMAINMIPKNEKIKEMYDGVMIFVDEIAYFNAISESYQGSDFCQGIMFGIHGSRLLIAAGEHMLKELPF
jgi:hypothetical protein